MQLAKEIGRSIMAETPQSRFHADVFDKAKEVEAKELTTYGQIATAMGCPRHSRHVGFALAKAPTGVPWWRVINSKGMISFRPKDRVGKGTKKSPFTSLQRKLLEKEGHTFSESGTLVGWTAKLHAFHDCDSD